MIYFKAQVYAGDTLKIPIEGLGPLTGALKVYFSAKRSKSDPDSRSILQIEQSEGLLFINASAAELPLHGGIVITGESEGNIIVHLQASESVLIAEATYNCDVKVIAADGNVETRMQGDITFMYGITKAVA